MSIKVISGRLIFSPIRAVFIIIIIFIALHFTAEPGLIGLEQSKAFNMTMTL